MTSARDHARALDRPFRQRRDIAGDFHAQPPHAEHRACRDYCGAEQHVMISALLGEIEPDTISAEPFVSAAFADRVFHGGTIVFESLPDDDSHFHALPAFGAKLARPNQSTEGKTAQLLTFVYGDDTGVPSVELTGRKSKERNRALTRENGVAA